MAIEAWYMDESNEDPRLPHHRNPKEYVSLDTLAEIGVLYWKLNAKDHENDPELSKIRQERGYNYMIVYGAMGKTLAAVSLEDLLEQDRAESEGVTIDTMLNFL